LNRHIRDLVFLCPLFSRYRLSCFRACQCNDMLCKKRTDALLLDRFSATNSIVFAQYFLIICEVPVTSNRQTCVALGVCTVAVAGKVSSKIVF
jgi:hypothetical protein